MAVAQINFTNKSLAVSAVDVVFFEPTGFYDAQTMRIPWLFIKQCPADFSYPFEYADTLEMCLRDDSGNYSSALNAMPGTRYVIRSVNGKEVLEKSGQGSGREIEVFNELPEGAPGILLCRSGKPTAFRANLAPGEFFSFRTPDALLVRKVSGVEQARRIKQLEEDGYSTLISMKGVTTADLLLTGGGNGASAKKYSFTLENINQYPFDYDS